MKILFVSKPGSDNFIRHYTNNMPESRLVLLNRKEDAYQLPVLARSYDCIVFEWANHYTAYALNNYHFPCPVIVRVHDHEVYQGRIHSVPWGRVDAVWFINRQVRYDFHGYYPHARSFYVPNCVDPAQFGFNPSNSRNIGLLSLYTKPRKRIDRAIELMRLLPEYSLTIRVDFDGDDDARKEYKRCQEMSRGMDNVVWQIRDFTHILLNNYPTDDVNAFWRDKAFSICTSEHEAFHYSSAEAALCGCVPILYNWEFGRPRDFWGAYVFDSLPEMANAIRFMQSEVLEAQDAARYWVIENFSPPVLVPRLQAELEAITKKLEA